MAILVCGGAGYIGSHVVRALLDRGEEVLVLDNMLTGHVDAVDERASLVLGDLRDEAFLDQVFQKHKVDGIIDFAAYSLVGESVTEPLKYFENNVSGTISLLKAMEKYKVKNIVFSSTAATYGEPENIPILESDTTFPTNPYGESKLCVEKILKWCDRAYGMKYTVLRYFNVAGAHESAEIGEAHTTETHLIPIVLQVALGQRESIGIYGDDYPTEDGTCIRDYIHVMDLADAHIKALDRLRAGGDSATFNLGNGEGFSVKEVIEVCRKVTGHPIPAVVSPRRAGDPAKLVASSKQAMEVLKWQPKYNRLEQIVSSAWAWHQSHPNGYED